MVNYSEYREDLRKRRQKLETHREDLLAQCQKLDTEREELATAEAVAARLAEESAADAPVQRQEAEQHPLVAAGVLRADAFRDMGLAAATLAFMKIVDKPQGTREIADGIWAGGVASKSEDPVGVVSKTVGRLVKEGKLERVRGAKKCRLPREASQEDAS